MKIVVKEDGKTVVEIKKRNELHFEIQRNTRSQQVLSFHLLLSKFVIAFLPQLD